MRIVALEEHFVTPMLVDAWGKLAGGEREDALGQMQDPDIRRRLLDLADERLAIMDDSGVDTQILSLTTPGPQNLPADVATAVARDANDTLAGVVRQRPDRFGGFAALPTPDPQAAARELERAVTELGLDGAILNGRTGTRNIDDRDLDPIYATAGRLRAPIYLHPQLPTLPVRDQLYAGLDDRVSQMFGQAAPGWHYETGVQLIRLILSGAFDRHPDLQVITGHWGEVVLFYLDRIAMLDKVAGLKRPIADYFRDHVSITGSGIWSQRYFRWAKEVLGAERILFATDYPYIQASDGQARAFMDAADLTDDERALVAHGNWDRIRAAIRR